MTTLFCRVDIQVFSIRKVTTYSCENGWISCETFSRKIRVAFPRKRKLQRSLASQSINSIPNVDGFSTDFPRVTSISSVKFIHVVSHKQDLVTTSLPR